MSKYNITGTNGNVAIKEKNIKGAISIGSIFVIVAVLFIYISFNSSEKKIIGAWQVEGQSQITVVFNDDNTCSISGEGNYLTGDYLLIGDNKIQMHIQYFWEDFILSGDITIKNNMMNVTNIAGSDDIFDIDGETITLIKVK